MIISDDQPSHSRALVRRAFLSGMAATALLNGVNPSIGHAASPDALNLEALEARHGGRIGLCAQAGNRRVGWRQDERFAYCSTFKLFLAACVLERAQRGAEKLDRQIPILKADMVSHAPVTGPAVGASLTIEQLCRAVVEVSDNPAANILIRELGGLEAWQGWYRGIGDQVTRVDRWETQLNTAIQGDPRDTTTALQYVQNIEKVMTTSFLARSHLALLERWLLDSPTGAGRIKASVPAGYRVGHKTGTGPKGTHNDIGIIRPPVGLPITIAIFMTGASDAAPEQIDAVIAEASRIALKSLGRG